MSHSLREAKPGGFQTGLFPTFFWEVLNGVGVDGVGGIFPFFSLFFVFLRFFVFFRFSSLFFVFLRFSGILLEDKGNDCYLLQKWGISLRPRLHRPRAKLPDKFSGKVQIVSRTLSGLFLVGALNRPRKRKGTNRENPWTIPEQIGKIPEKSGKSQKGQKRKDKPRSGNPPV